MLLRNKKKNDLNEGKWIGVGGKFEEGEAPEECLIREVKEETGLTLTSHKLRGIVTFISDKWENEYMFLYTADAFTSENDIQNDENGLPIIECNEGELHWIDKDKILELNLWEGDHFFLELLAQDAPFFMMKVAYEGDKLIECNYYYL